MCLEGYSPRKPLSSQLRRNNVQSYICFIMACTVFSSPSISFRGSACLMKSRVSTTISQRPRTLSSRSCCAFKIYKRHRTTCQCHHYSSMHTTHLLHGGEDTPCKFCIWMDLPGCQGQDGD